MRSILILLIVAQTGLAYNCYKCSNWNSSNDDYDPECDKNDYLGKTGNQYAEICYTEVYYSDSKHTNVKRGSTLSTEEDGSCSDSGVSIQCYCVEDLCNSNLCEHCPQWWETDSQIEEVKPRREEASIQKSGNEIQNLEEGASWWWVSIIRHWWEADQQSGEADIQKTGDDIPNLEKGASWGWHSTTRRWWETTSEVTTDRTEYPTTSYPCGGDYEGTEGEITSPNYPHYYPDNADCEWTVNTPNGTTIKVNFESFNTEKYCDYLEIRDGLGSDGLPLARLTGANATFNDSYIVEIVSSSNGLYFNFYSDSSQERSGFKLYWIAENTSIRCGGYQEGTEGTISSPNYPRDYPNDAECEWVLTSPDDTRITVNFESFNTERGYDYLEIRDGDDYNDLLLLNITGHHSTVQEITSTGNVLSINFISDYVGQESGFKFNWFAATTTDVPSTPSGPLQCYSCIGCDSIDGDTNVIGSEDFLACFVAVEIGHDHFVFRGGSPDYFQDGSCRHEADGGIVCYCTSNMCNNDAAMELLLLLGQ